MVYRKREWMVTISHLWTMVSRNMFLRLSLIFNFVSDGNDVFLISLIWLFFIYKIQKVCNKMVCFNIILHQYVQNYRITSFYFFIHDCQIYPCFSRFWCRTEWTSIHNLLESKSVDVQYFDWIFSGASWVNTETRLFDKNRNFIFSGFSFRATLPSDILFSCLNHM